MKFLAGLFAGMLVAGPSQPDVTNHYHETLDVRLEQPADRLIYPLPDVEVVYGDGVGQEGCLVELLGGPTAPWDVEDVLNALDRAWSEFDGPCDAQESGEW